MLVVFIVFAAGSGSQDAAFSDAKKKAENAAKSDPKAEARAAATTPSQTVDDSTDSKYFCEVHSNICSIFCDLCYDCPGLSVLPGNELIWRIMSCIMSI